MTDNEPPVPAAYTMLSCRLKFVAYAGEIPVWWDAYTSGEYLIRAPGDGRGMWLHWDGTWFTRMHSCFAHNEATPAQLCDLATLISRHYEEHVDAA